MRIYPVTAALIIVALTFSRAFTAAGDSTRQEIPPSDKPYYVNRLVKENSPYLLQHAHNPVDWYPWSDEAFKKAKAEDKPILLSIGYSTSLWCHAMNRESFQSQEIAGLINTKYVAVMVDREERPDIDNLYASAVQSISGSTGSPLTVFLTPEGKPFFGGTYFPPDDSGEKRGLKSLLLTISDSWKKRRLATEQEAERVTGLIRSQAEAPDSKAELSGSVMEKAYKSLAFQYDPDYGGFGPEPKYPMPGNISFLLRYHNRNRDAKALDMAKSTLDSIKNGSVYDHIGGGFYRYSTDRMWKAPNFEKALSDQAMLAKAYLEAYQLTCLDEYASVARDTLDYMIRDLSGPDGAFYSAEGADSQAVNGTSADISYGAYYLWAKTEILLELGERPGEIFCYVYGVTDSPIMASGEGPRFSGKNVLYRAHSIKDAADHFKMQESEVAAILKKSRAKLLERRSQRVRPELDNNILTDWNALAISSLAIGSRVLDEPKYLEAAKRCAHFLLSNMNKSGGKLMHCYNSQTAATMSYLDDYAFLAQAMLDLYEATFITAYLKEAVELNTKINELFLDRVSGGYYFSGTGASGLLARGKVFYDGELPSGNSIEAMNLQRLSGATSDKSLEVRAGGLFSAAAEGLTMTPGASLYMLMAYDFLLGPADEILIVSRSRGNTTAKEMSSAIFKEFLPNKVVLSRIMDEDGEIKAIAPWVSAHGLVDGKPTVYICQSGVCGLPLTSVDDLKRAISER